MSAWLQQAIDKASSVNDWLSPIRAEALQALKQESWPTRKTEAWKYTPLTPLERTEFSQVTNSAAVDIDSIAGLNSIDLVFVDGVLVTSTNALMNTKGLTISSIESSDEETRLWAAGEFGQIKPKRHLFGLVNDVLATQGVIVNVDAGTKFKQPIRLIHLQNNGNEAHTRVLVRLGDNANASIIEQFTGDQNSFSTSVAEFSIGKEAKLEHYRFCLQTGDSMTVGGSHFRLQEKASLNSQLVGYGSKLARIDVDVDYAGEQATAKLNAIYLLKDKEVFDLHSTIEHAVPNCVTDETVRGIVGDHAKATFNGRIHIHRDAQKTLAELSNKNLLLARTAQINTKPELEIYADDVKCAHGATVAELDKSALYYMMSRGISKEDALVMLNFGFINALVDEMPNEALAEWLRPILKTRFQVMGSK
jgi:Fe-S cluster assembly protein SufD